MDSVVDNKKVFGISVSIEKADGSLDFVGSAGNLEKESQFFIASTTKLYITAIIMRMREDGILSMARFRLPRIFSPFKAMPELLGHSGLSGAFAFYSPLRNVYLTGTVNQIHYPSTSFKLMLQLINSIK